jgi:predicted transcriptional regulator
MEFINAHLDKSWNWNAISYNPNLTFDFVKAHPNRPWDWLAISRHKNITMDIIEANIEMNWNWTCIYHNPNLTFDFADKYSSKIQKYSWYLILSNKYTKEREQVEEEVRSKYTTFAVDSSNIMIDLEKVDIELVDTQSTSGAKSAATSTAAMTEAQTDTYTEPGQILYKRLLKSSES